MKPHAAPRSTPPSRDVSPDQLVVVPGKLPLDPALDALAEHLVDLWLRRRARVGTSAPEAASEAVPGP